MELFYLRRVPSSLAGLPLAQEKEFFVKHYVTILLILLAGRTFGQASKQSKLIVDSNLVIEIQNENVRLPVKRKSKQLISSIRSRQTW
ncbi:MAG TPA: hypothetical protein VD884_12465 [Ohtaekwangia sp.]|nr:hypothetical protein [Ohtaekwangia sp.]